jgi:hypothetical protein
MLQRPQRAGKVIRTTDPADRRAVLVGVTESSRALRPEIEAAEKRWKYADKFDESSDEIPVLVVLVQTQLRRLEQAQRPRAEEVAVTSSRKPVRSDDWASYGGHHGHTSVRPAGRPRGIRQPSSTALAGRWCRRGGLGGRVFDVCH